MLQVNSLTAPEQPSVEISIPRNLKYILSSKYLLVLLCTQTHAHQYMQTYI